MNMLRFLALSPIGALLVGCATTPAPIGGSPGIQVAELSALPPPGPADYHLSATDGLVKPLDRLQISVLGFPELGRQLQVGPSGSFDLPLINSVQASGRSTSEISEEIEARLRGPYIVNPEVTVDVTERSARLLTIGGEVESPGRYPVLGEISLLEAVALGGGVSEYANLQDVLILRTVNGQNYIGAYNLGAIQRGNYADPAIYADDIVMVGDSPARRRLLTIISLAPLLTTPVIVFDRLLR